MPLTMNKMLLVLACLCLRSHGQRVPSQHSHSPFEVSGALPALATLLLAFNPAASPRGQSPGYHAKFLAPVGMRQPSHFLQRPQRSSPVVASLVLERAPPAPPPSGTGGGDEGGDGDGFCVQEVSSEQQASILNDWAAQTRIYKMTGSFGGDETVGQLHQRSQIAIEALSKFKAGEELYPGSSVPMMWGLVDGAMSHSPPDSGNCAAVLTTKVSANGEWLIVLDAVVRPRDLNDKAATASFQVFRAAKALAKKFNVRLDRTSLDEKLTLNYIAHDEQNTIAEDELIENQ